jgi:protein CpxP
MEKAMKVSMAIRLGVAMAGLFTAASVLAQGPGHMPGQGPEHMNGEHRPPFERAFGGPGVHGRWWNNPKIAEELKLTDEQKKAFDATLLEHRETLIDLRGNVEKAELAMEPLIRDDQPNEGKILAQIDKVAQARAELEKANARYLLAIRAKLTPEQWKQVQAFRANHGQEGRDREERGPRHGREGMRHGPPPSPPPAPGAGGDQ